MLDPEYLKHCADELDELFADLETSILEDIARRIVENKYQNTSTATHQLNRAKALGLQYDVMKKKMAEIMKISEKKVAEIITQASYGSVGEDNVIFKEAYEKGIIHKFNYDEAGLAKIILSGIESTNGEIKNICKTTAKTAKKLLSDTLDMTYLSVQSGAFSQQDAVKLAVDTIARRGISWIDYESGAHRRVDTTIRTALRSGVNQTACRCQDKNFEDMGGNLVEVTSHMGARPSHAQWQGRIYWRKEKYKNYQNFELATGYGRGDGLGGWNCRHSFFPYFEGLSSKSFEHYRTGENKERYELDQEQRYNERMVREWKRRSTVNKAGKIDNSKEARKVREWEQRQRNLLKAHPELKRNYAREQAYNTKGILQSDKKILDGLKIAVRDVLAKPVKYDQLPTDFKEQFVKGLKKSDPLTKEILKQNVKRYNYRLNKSRQHVNIGANSIVITKSDMGSFVHEVFHMIDIKNNITANGAFTSIYTDYQDLLKISGGDIVGYLVNTYPEHMMKNVKTGKYVLNPLFRGIDDILNGLSNGEIKMIYSHPKSYWNDDTIRKEAFAQYGKISYNNDESVMDFLNTLFPMFTNEVRDTLKGMLK